MVGKWSFVFIYMMGILTFVFTTHHTDQAFTNENKNTVSNEIGEINAELSQLERKYHGIIKENETLVELTPPIFNINICQLHIVKSDKHYNPFYVQLQNGYGRIHSKKFLNCEHHNNYHFEIYGTLCNGGRTEISDVFITVMDINEYAPVFRQPSYVVEIDENRIYKEIIRVEASDKDCTPLYGDVCKYEILNTRNTPFIINNDGIISNIIPLTYKTGHNHIFSVIAYDCAMRASSAVMVTIRLKYQCKSNLIIEKPQVFLVSNNTTEISLFNDAITLNICNDFCPSNNQIEILSKIKLLTNHIGFGCDRELKNCLKKNTINLLSGPWMSELQIDDGSLNNEWINEEVFHFDGQSGAIIPKDALNVSDFSQMPFSIATIFRHKNAEKTIANFNNKRIKEHIICLSDETKMNRHHMSLFIRNCRLILLIRHSYNVDNLNIFSPAEWRWKLPEICDNEWHQYVVNVNLPDVRLYIDGIEFIEKNSTMNRKNYNYGFHQNPEIIDDWPLHAVHGVNTTLTVGACFQGKESRLMHSFSGDIGGLYMTTDRILTEDEIACGVDCVEYLHINKTDGNFKINSQRNEVNFKSNSIQSFISQLKSINYTNIKNIPTIGRRNIKINLTIKCNSGYFKSTHLSEINTYILVNQKPFDNIMSSIDNAIRFIGNHTTYAKYIEIKNGINLYKTIQLPVVKMFDKCFIQVYPKLNVDHESLKIEYDKLNKFNHIKASLTTNGCDLIGYDNSNNYVELLKNIIYINKKPAYYLNRIFKLKCIESDKTLNTNIFISTLIVLHPHQLTQMEGNKSILNRSQTMYSHVKIHKNEIDEGRSHLKTVGTYFLGDSNNLFKYGNTTLLIVTICFVFIFILIGISVLKMRHTKQTNKLKRELLVTDQSQTPTTVITKNISEQSNLNICSGGRDILDWDDTSLTITINPIEDKVNAINNISDVGDSESEEDILGDSDSEIYDYGKKLRNDHQIFSHKGANQLEWDNSMM